MRGQASFGIGLVSALMAAASIATVASAQIYGLDKRDAGYRERLTVIDEAPGPVIGPDDPGLGDNRSGFETGVTLKVGATYHLFISEMFGRPHLDMRIAHWRSADAVHWTRAGTTVASEPDRSATQPRAEVWMQAMIFDEAIGRWTMFYIAYRGGNPAKGEGLNLDYEGQVHRAVAETPGRAGIDGAFRDAGVVMRPDARSAPWEGQQGVDSFFPYKVGNRWITLHGSHNHVPPSPWQVGVAEAPKLDATVWTRIAREQPSPIEDLFVENPIVLKLPSGRFIAVYDANNYPNQPDLPARPGNSVGYSISDDGVRWHQGRALVVQTKPETSWSSDLRTPLGLVPEGGDVYTLLYSAKMKDKPFWAIGRVKVRLTMDGGAG